MMDASRLKRSESGSRRVLAGLALRAVILLVITAAIPLFSGLAHAIDRNSPRVADLRAPAPTTNFAGVFVGTDDGLNNTPAEADPQQMADELNDLPGWAALSQDVIVETGIVRIPNLAGDGTVNYDNDAPGVTEAEIVAAVGAHKAALQPGDEFIFYFAGHGATLVPDGTGPGPGDADADPDCGFLHKGSAGMGATIDQAPVDEETGGDGDECWFLDGGDVLTDDEVTVLLSGFRKSVTITVIIDSCEAGGFVGGTKDLNSATDENGDVYDNKHFRVLMAVPDGQSCSASAPTGGVFTNAMEACLNPNAAPVADGNTDGVVTSDELFNCVLSNPAAAAQSPQRYARAFGVGGVAELPEVAGTSLETDGSSGASTGVLAGAIAGAVFVGGVTLGGAAWYARRRRAR